MPIGVYHHKPRPEKVKRKISKTMKRYFKIHPSNTKGMKFSQETCNKMSKSHSGKRHFNWKGGRRYQEKNGYILIYAPNHPFKIKGNYIYEHRFIMEKHLKRYLKSKEVVHHINGIKDDNHIENLKLFHSESEHQKFHQRLR